MTTASEALTELLAQHETLHAIMDHCEQLADELDADRGSAEVLVREVAKLRIAFDTHNQSEEQMLRPLLRNSDSFGEARIEHMVADHLDEHHVMGERLATGPTAELRATLANLREHLATEERYFLSSRIVRDDLVVVDGGG